MHWSFAIGTIKGTVVRIHVTFLIFLGWIVLAAYSTKGSQAALSAGLFFLLLFGSVLFHEFGHILTARRFGVRTPDVILLPIGGISRMDHIPEQPRQELLIALAGPAVNLLIGGAIALALGGLPPHPHMDVNNLGATFWSHLAFANIALALFNLLPAFPMDGGRALRAILSWRLGYSRGTRAAAATGQVAAVLLGILGIVSGNFILTIIALFIYFSAAAESGTAGLREASLGVVASDVMITGFETLRADESIDAAVETLIHTHQKEFLVLDESGKLVGLVTREQITGALKAGLLPGRIRSVMSSEVPVTAPGQVADRALNLLERGARAVAVVDGRGRVAGMITLENLAAYVLLAGQRRRLGSRDISVPHVALATPAVSTAG